jgi:hypothetical protein
MAEIGEGGEQWFHECMTCRLTSRKRDTFRRQRSPTRSPGRGVSFLVSHRVSRVGFPLLQRR